MLSNTMFCVAAFSFIAESVKSVSDGKKKRTKEKEMEGESGVTMWEGE